MLLLLLLLSCRGSLYTRNIYSLSGICSTNIFLLFSWIHFHFVYFVGTCGSSFWVPRRKRLWEMVEWGYRWVIRPLLDQFHTQICFQLACLRKAAVLALGHQGATSSYLDCKALAKALWSAHGCQTSVYVTDEAWYCYSSSWWWLSLAYGFNILVNLFWERDYRKNLDVLIIIDSHPDCAMH